MRKHFSINALLALVLSVCLLCSCDGLKHMLGMKTSSEIEQMKQMDSDIAKRQQAIKDSLALLKSSEQQQVSSTAELAERYYVILGSFKEQSNVNLMMNDAKAFGFTPVVIPLKNGYTMVAASGHSTLQQACSEKIRVEDLDICPYDIWIYDTAQGLHE